MEKCKKCGVEIDALHLDNPKEELCFSCNFWQQQHDADLKCKDHEFAIIDGKHYRIGPEDAPAYFRGFGGDKFVIKFHDGTEVITTNLWYQGEIPDVFKKDMPNNADFCWQWKQIGDCNYLVPKEE